MSDFDDDNDDLSNFQQGVADATDKPVVFIDPNAFDGLNVDLEQGIGAKLLDLTSYHFEIMCDMLVV